MERKLTSLLTAAATLAIGSSAAGNERREFVSGGKKIGVEVFRPETESKSPGLLVLHGAGGMDYGNAYVRQLAGAFAGQGYATYLVHYFDRTGHRYAADETILKHFETWLSTLTDGVTFLTKQSEVDSERIAVFGYSLGGYLAVALAAQEPRVRAVVELAGGIDSSFAKRVQRMPPTLILHGEEDRRVLVSRANELEQVLRKVDAPFEKKIYPGEGHMLSPLSALDAMGRGLAFLQKHLR